ncbi:hypothetical protein ACL03H_20490 [Saccharopolyspora sp. MS10]|uniref:hypothetical protein n=1 Tax=Saccharopolyspora sp. MS10 TaxID=3385973 RepID=UPI0039A2B8D3
MTNGRCTVACRAVDVRAELVPVAAPEREVPPCREVLWRALVLWRDEPLPPDPLLRPVVLLRRVELCAVVPPPRVAVPLCRPEPDRVPDREAPELRPRVLALDARVPEPPDVPELVALVMSSSPLTTHGNLQRKRL